MSLEGNITQESLKNFSNAIDSYRVRALIDAKKEVLNAGVYNESQYYEILFKLFDEEKAKFELLTFLNKTANNDLESLKGFVKTGSFDMKKILALLEILKNEKLIVMDEIFDKIPATETTPEKSKFKNYAIKLANGETSKLKSIYEPVKVIFSAHTCSGCGLCSGICPVKCITINNGEGKIDDDKCVRCGLCYYICPRSFLPVKALHLAQSKSPDVKEYSSIGPFSVAYSARTKVDTLSKVCQDGGISSTVLYYLFDKNKIDFAIGAKISQDPWRPEPFLMKSKEDVALAAGTKYVNDPNLSLLNQTQQLAGKRIAVVGVPCMMQALLKSELYGVRFPSINAIQYRIGIFCMESFSYPSLLKICEHLKVEVTNARKMDISKGNFYIRPKDKEAVSVPVKEISHLAREDCEICFDLTSESADISIGSIGSAAGWNTVIARNEKGKALFEDLKSSGLVEFIPIEEAKPGLPMLQKIAGVKKSNCNKHIASRKGENKRFPSY